MSASGVARALGGLLVVAGLLVPLAARAEPRRLTLEQALATAATQQPQLRAARAQQAAAVARIDEATTGYLPRVEAQGQYQRATSNFVLSPAFANSPFARTLEVRNRLAPGDTVNYFVFGATASQTLFDFGRTGSLADQARAAAAAQAAEADGSADTVALNVRTAFFASLAAGEIVKLATETVANQRKHVAQVANFVTVGTRPKIDLVSAELVLANAELGLVRARNAEASARLQLAAALGTTGAAANEWQLEPTSLPALPEEDDGGAPASSPASLVALAAARAEYRRAEANLRREEAERRGVRSAYLPALVASANLSGTKVGAFDPGFNWYVGLGLNWNLSGIVVAGRQAVGSDARIASAAATRDAVSLGIATEIDQQRLAVREVKERIAVADRAVSAATLRLKLAEARYQAGTSDILELDDAQIMEANIKAERVQAQHDLSIARARLVRALGRK